MREIGVRELKQALSKVLRDVGRGDQVRVTLRGRPLADIVPPGARPEENRLSELIAEGRVIPPARTRPKRAPSLVEARQPASLIVLAERDAER